MLPHSTDKRLQSPPFTIRDTREEVQDRPVYPSDLIGSIYQLLGIDPDAPLPNPLGMSLTVTPSAADGIPMAGRLKEIM